VPKLSVSYSLPVPSPISPAVRQRSSGGLVALLALAPHSRREGRFAQADFFVCAGNTMTFARCAPALCHSQPHWQRTESHNRGFLRSALHTAHDLIHMVLLPSRIRFGLGFEGRALMLCLVGCSQCASGGTSGQWPRRAEWHHVGAIFDYPSYRIGGGGLVIK